MKWITLSLEVWEDTPLSNGGGGANTDLPSQQKSEDKANDIYKTIRSQMLKVEGF